MTRDQIRQAADILRETVSTRDYAARIGLQVNRGGFVQCFMHQGDRNGSLKVYGEPRRGFHCFGCGASGDVIELAKRFYNLNFPQAIKKVAEDTGIALPGVKMTYDQEKAIKEAQAHRIAREQAEQAEKAADDAYYQTLGDFVAIDRFMADAEEKIVEHLKEHPIIMPENLEPGIYEDENDENVYPDEELMDAFFKAMVAKEKASAKLHELEIRRTHA